MTATQRALKYGAMAFAIFLSVTIIYGIASAGIGLLDLFVGSSGTVQNFDQTFTEVTGLDISTGVGKLTIENGEQFRVVGENVDEKFSCKVKRGTLVIDNVNNVRGLFRGNSKKRLNKLTVYIPQNYELKTFSINAGVGDIEIFGLTAEKMDIDMGTGNLRGSNMKAGKLTLDGGVGNSTFENLAFDSADINAGVGNIRIEPVIGRRSDYAIDVDSGVGTIRIDGERVKDGYEENKSQSKKLELDGGVGDISVDFSELE